MEIPVYNQKAEKSGTVAVSEAVFGLKWNADLVHQVATSQEANKRQKVAHVKDRAQVRGGGRKPWRQKGTGRARHGSIRSPLWKGGGVTHGPAKEENLKRKINKKMAKKALFTVLSAKAKDGEVIVMNEISFEGAKTRNAAALFEHFAKKTDFAPIKKGNGALVVLAGKDDASRRALRNLSYVGIEEAGNLHAHEALQYKFIIFPKSVLAAFVK